MKKHRNKIITGIVIAVILATALLCGGGEDVAPESVSTQDAPVETEVQTTIETSKEVAIPELNKTTEVQDSKKGSPEDTEIINVPDTKSEETTDLNEEHTCILSVRCDTILENMSHLDKAKVGIIPEDGIIFAEKTVVFYEGESVFNVLVREMKRNKIHMEFEMSPIYETAYIKGIANIYEFDCGELSGWLYKVNNVNPGVGCSLYSLKDGDRIEWIYSCG